MKHNWNQQILQSELQRRPVEKADALERRATERAQAIRATANWLYMGGELLRAAQLLMELETPGSWA
jgi:hypothetical protein